ncbi:MAG: nitrile hydratase subunit alpha [Deltaproteobacteria bacterium]|nr:nitrile hydratase subunit alpha [Deltaproteobacteria bacterium]
MSDPRQRVSPAPVAERARALEEALVAKEIVPEGFIDMVTARAEQELSPRNGARVVARAWVDVGYRARLLADGTAACAELGFHGPQGEYIVVLENTPTLHNVIVCTQCSCTAWPVLGLPPDWYKSPEYRARVVREPRALLREMGLDLPEGVTIRVWDTTAETRYMVLPLRPPGTEGWSEEQLAGIVTREAMIGVAKIDVS